MMMIMIYSVLAVMSSCSPPKNQSAAGWADAHFIVLQAAGTQASVAANAIYYISLDCGGLHSCIASITMIA